MQKKKLLLEGGYGSFFFPIHSKIAYDKLDRKLKFYKFFKKDLHFSKLSSVLLVQASLGVLLGFRKQLNVVGIGYNVEVQDNTFLVMKLGFSHLVKIKIPEYLEVKCPKPRIILLRGINLQKINNFASVIRNLKLPSAYKEKGIYFSGERLFIKQGKKT